MLHYRHRCSEVEPSYSPVNNFGFQRRASLACSFLIYKRKLKLNQSIFVFQALLELGSMSFIIFMNFVKYIK
jgi:hypothetical protein